MYRWLALLILTFSITGASAEDELPDVVNETSIDPPSEDEEEPSGISNEVLMIAAAVVGVSIIIAALIMRG
tara:strand:+ start:752 stop:964 length:213 start_codon:yes stop_codon:yes gene_type:complete